MVSTMLPKPEFKEKFFQTDDVYRTIAMSTLDQDKTLDVDVLLTT